MGKEICQDIKDGKKEMGKSIDACKAMLFLAIFATTGAIASAILLMVVMKDKQKLLFIAGGLDIASGFFLMIAMAVYADKCKLYGTNLDYGFALDIIAWLATWAAGGIFIASKFLTKV
ncbi:uncharacterized protein LOC132733437 [Ruditapes philippinarum]|uniref:uncharacterized protein LOC132733437 n=1 Tax=Ruditapes philippinarum TaxID=129788 RepID=UPI00295ABB1B|nr:uncharacterized protein LOC132733437 [Ruditapes philippinarum]